MKLNTDHGQMKIRTIVQQFLELNVDKINKIVIDFRKVKPDPNPVMLKGESVERVSVGT